MNKQELLIELNKAWAEQRTENTYQNGIKNGIELGIRLAEKLEEPAKVEPLIVPKIVADWYEENEDNLEYDMFNLVATLIEKDYDELTELEAWFNNYGNEPIETIMRMKLFSYEEEVAE